MAPLTAPVKWAQRKNSLFVTIDIPDIDEKTAKIELTDSKLTFKGKNEENEYVLDLEFLHEIDAKSEESKYSVKSRCVSFYLIKKEEESWNRLLKDKILQKTNVKCDFDKWVDSDEENDENNFNTSGMGGMGNMDMNAMMEQMKNMQTGAGPSFDDELTDSDDYDDPDDDSDLEDEALDGPEIKPPVETEVQPTEGK